MNRLGQVAHVARKDVLQSRWLVGAYLVLVIVTTTSFLLDGERDGGWYRIIPLLITLVGILTAAAFVQSDSPTRGSAFWLSRPLDPTAVLSAKATSVLVIVLGSGLLGQAVCLATFHLPLHEFLSLLFGSLYGFLLLLILTMMGASLTSNLRNLLTAGVMSYIGAMFVMQAMLAGHVSRAPWWSNDAASIAAGVAAIAVLIHVYRTHDTSRRIEAAGVAVVCLAIIGGNFPSIARYVPPPAAPGGVHEQDRVQISLQSRSDIVPKSLQLRLWRTGGAADERWRLLETTATIELADGRTIRRSLDNRQLVISQENALLAAGYRTHGSQNFTIGPVGADVPLNEDDTRIMQTLGPIKRIVVEGQLEVSKSEVTGRMPLERGASLLSRGTRIRLTEAAISTGGAELTIEGSSPPRADARSDESFPVEFISSEFVLANDAKREIAGLQAAGGGGSNLPLVIPGVTISSFTKRLATPPADGRNAPPSEEWLAGASLAVMRWKLQSVQPIHVVVDQRPSP